MFGLTISTPIFFEPQQDLRHRSLVLRPKVQPRVLPHDLLDGELRLEVERGPHRLVQVVVYPCAMLPYRCAWVSPDRQAEKAESLGWSGVITFVVCPEPVDSCSNTATL